MGEGEENYGTVRIERKMRGEKIPCGVLFKACRHTRKPDHWAVVIQVVSWWFREQVQLTPIKEGNECEMISIASIAADADIASASVNLCLHKQL